MRRPVAAGVAVLAVAVAVAVTAWKVVGDGSGGLEGEVAFGVLAPSSGPGNLPARARDLNDGASMAAAEINDDGGLLGRRVVLDVVDDACAPLIGYEAAKSFAEGGGVAGVLGGVCEETAAREVPVVDAGGIPFLVTTANGADLVPHGTASAYLLNGTVYQQALSAVYWMNYRHAQRLAIVGDASAESQALAKNVIRLIDQAPRLVSLQKVAVGKTDLTTEAKAAVASRPDFVFWTGSAASGGALAKALHEFGFKGTFTASAESESPDFLAAAGHDGAEGAFVTATASPHNLPNTSAWRQRFQAAYHHEPGLDAMQAYDAVRILAQATRQAGDPSGEKVAGNLMKLTDRLTTFLGVVRFARDHTLLYDNRVILVVKDGAFAWERSLRTDSLQG